jgi:hypothetical protein
VSRSAVSTKPQFLDSIVIDDWRFPVVIRRVAERLQGPTVLPANGWSSCWARTRTRTAAPIGPGLLTAGHVCAKLQKGSIVPLDNGQTGILLDVAPPGIDAAVIGTEELPPLSVAALPMTPTSRRSAL